MEFLDKPRRYLPAQKEYRDCDVCGCHTLLLIPCSHWHCSNCGYDTRTSDYKLSKLKKEYKEIRKLNLEASQKLYDLQRKNRVSKWIKCIDCKYSCVSDFDLSKLDCDLPTYCHRDNDQLEMDFDKNEFVACVYGEKDRKSKLLKQ